MAACRRQELILLSTCPPQVAAALPRKRGALDGWRRRLQTVDRTLLVAVPALGRRCWDAEMGRRGDAGAGGKRSSNGRLARAAGVCYNGDAGRGKPVVCGLRRVSWQW